MTPDPHSWAADLESLWDQVWLRLIRGVQDRRAPARHPTLATVALDGRPQARSVVLRAADRSQAWVEVHTDLRSAKVAEVRATPFAALHVWDAQAHLQVRLEAGVQVLTGPGVAAIWERVPEPSRLAYGSVPPPGQPIPEALAYAKAPDPAAFAILRLTLHRIEALHLGPQHRRARFDRARDWAGEWLAP